MVDLDDHKGESELVNVKLKVTEILRITLKGSRTCKNLSARLPQQNMQSWCAWQVEHSRECEQSNGLELLLLHSIKDKMVCEAAWDDSDVEKNNALVFSNCIETE